MKKEARPVSVLISVHIHATESEEKVIRAVENVLPNNIKLKDFDITREEFSGHHGNSIVRLEFRLRGRKVDELFKYLISKLSDQIYQGWFSERFDKNGQKFYLRLDKQSAYLNDLRVGLGDDVIRVVFTFPGYLRLNKEFFESIIRERYNLG